MTHSRKLKILYYTIIAISLLVISGYFLIVSKLNQNINHNNHSNKNSHIANNSEQVIIQALINNTIKNACKREIIIPKFSSDMRLVREIYEITSEVAMYHADRYLDLNMVPTTIIKTKPTTSADQAAIISSCTLWITPAEIPKITSSKQLQNLVSEIEYAQMNIFYFLFGQYDRHFNNLIIAQNDHKLYLIDNEAVSRVYQYVANYSPDKTISSAWVPWASSKLTINIPHEPDNFAEIIKSKQDPAWIMREFGPYVDVYTRDDINCQACKVWKQTLWRQLYVCDDKFAAPFSDIIDPKLLAKIKTLDREILLKFWPKLPFIATAKELYIYYQFINTFINKTLERKQMILDYFDQHPESIRTLSQARKL
jgi:hypothetical protein